MIYSNRSDKDVKMMIVALEPDEATVVQVRLKASDLQKWMNDGDDDNR